MVSSSLMLCRLWLCVLLWLVVFSMSVVSRFVMVLFIEK